MKELTNNKNYPTVSKHSNGKSLPNIMLIQWARKHYLFLKIYYITQDFPQFFQLLPKFHRTSQSLSFLYDRDKEVGQCGDVQYIF